MKLKRMVNYTVDPTQKMGRYSAIFVGISLFARVLHYYLFRDLSACSPAEAVFCLILPLVISVAWLLIIRAVPLTRPIVFAVVAALMLVFVGIEGFYSMNTILAVLALLWYLATGAAVVLVSLGYVPYRILIFVTCIIPGGICVCSAFLTHIVSRSFWEGLPQYAVCFHLLALACYSGMLRMKK